MTDTLEDSTKRKVARVAGVMFLCSTIVPTLNWTLVASKYIVPDNGLETARSVLAHQLLFRIGIVNQLMTSAIAIALAMSLFVILKSVNLHLAMLGLTLKLIEASLIAVGAFGSFAALLILGGQAGTPVGASEQIQTLVGLFLTAHMPLAAISMVFLGLNFSVFFYVLLKSKYVPPSLAGFGLVSYVLILLYALITILLPSLAAIMPVQIFCWTPSVIFELVIGIWLLAKGLRLPSLAGAAGATF